MKTGGKWLFVSYLRDTTIQFLPEVVKSLYFFK